MKGLTSRKSRRGGCRICTPPPQRGGERKGIAQIGTLPGQGECRDERVVLAKVREGVHGRTAESRSSVGARIRRGYKGLVHNAGWTNRAARAGDCSAELSPGTAPSPGRYDGGGKSRDWGLSADGAAIMATVPVDK